jgi:cardiolipin synthase (CMP-forming)
MDPEQFKNDDQKVINIFEESSGPGLEENPKKLANRLTLFRALLIPVFISFLLYDQPVHALVTFLVAAITDLIDGIIARKWHQQTPVGAMLDPLADKFLITSGFIMLSMKSQTNHNLIPLWLTVLVLTRDTLIVAVNIIIHMLSGEINITPSIYGKIATFTQVSLLTLILVFNTIGIIPVPIRYFFIALVGFFTTLSGLHYLFRTAGAK